MSKKTQFPLSYIAVFSLPLLVTIALSYLSLDVTWIMPVLLCLGFLFGLELDAERRGSGYLWKHISRTTRDKVVFELSLILFLGIITWRMPENPSVALVVVRLLVAFCIQAAVFSLFATPETRLLVWKDFILHRKING